MWRKREDEEVTLSMSQIRVEIIGQSVALHIWKELSALREGVRKDIDFLFTKGGVNTVCTKELVSTFNQSSLADVPNWRTYVNIANPKPRIIDLQSMRTTRDQFYFSILIGLDETIDNWTAERHTQLSSSIPSIFSFRSLNSKIWESPISLFPVWIGSDRKFQLCCAAATERNK